MEPGRPSQTAERAALLRAAHQLFDRPRVLEDPVVLRLLGPTHEAALRADTTDLERPAVRRLRASIALRSRYAEDRLAAAIRRGVHQYVVLGAGLDSFAYRNPFPADTLRVFEVDHPATQAWKRARLQDAGIAVPPALTFIPTDFERQTLREALAAGGVDLSAPAFVSWLGVTMYLTREAALRTLTVVAALAPGSEIVFGYVAEPSSLAGPTRAALTAMAERAAASGEPWLTFFDPAALATDLASLGFTGVEDLGPEDAFARYFAGRTDGLRPGSAGRLMAAVVPS